METLILQLKEHIKKLPTGVSASLTDDMLGKLYSVYPFNRFEYIISHLIAEKVISLGEYLEIRNNYLNRNKYLYIFEITAPRTFGETWAQRHLNEIVPEFEHPSFRKIQTIRGNMIFGSMGLELKLKLRELLKEVAVKH